MRRIDRACGWLGALAVCAGLVAPGAPARAEASAADDDRMAELERRIDELEAERAGDEDDAADGGSAWSSAWAEWTRRVSLGGSANAGYYWGSDGNVLEGAGFEIWDARFFVDAELGSDLRLGSVTLVRNAGFSFEWNLVRLGRLYNDVGDLYFELQGLGGTTWANLQLGRFQIPVGEAYLRYGRGYADKPFISNTVGGTWFWDEGIKVYGSGDSGLFSYVASITAGETGFNESLSGDYEYTLKLMTDPTPWLHLSVSGMYGGAIGTDQDPGSGGALWLGETWARNFCSSFAPGPGVPNYIDGAVVPDSPQRIQQTWYVGGDAVLESADRVRLWLSYGYFDIDQGDPLYDRALHQWIAELVLHGSLVTPRISKLYLGLRANGLGTYDTGKGYLIDFRTDSTLGYNTKYQEVYSVVLGWKMFRYLTARLEYSRYQIDTVDGVDPAISAFAGGSNVVAFELGGHF